MNKYMVHIITSVICILIPVFGLIYFLWDSYQPQLGAVGDGKTNYPSIPQLIPVVFCFILGVVNLHIAITRYRQHKKTIDDENGLN